MSDIRGVKALVNDIETKIDVIDELTRAIHHVLMDEPSVEQKREIDELMQEIAYIMNELRG